MNAPARLRPKRLFGNAPGAAPGLLAAHAGAHRTTINILRYGVAGLLEDGPLPPGAYGTSTPDTVTWIDVQGMADTDTIAALAEGYGLHPLAVEDAVSNHQRAKTELYPNHLFVVVRQPDGDPQDRTEQLALFLGVGFVITFQERSGDCLDPVRARIRASTERMRQGGAPYLAYALLDAVVDSYFPWVEASDAELEQVEDLVLGGRADTQTIDTVARLRRRFTRLRRILRGLNDCLEDLREIQPPLVTDATRVYLRDAQDHLRRMLDQVEYDRDAATSLREHHLSRLNHELNDIMRVLTMISTIFIPLSFLAGVWGMNFEHMPELKWPLGYPLAFLLMGTVTIAQLRFFHQRGWLARVARPARPG